MFLFVLFLTRGVSQESIIHTADSLFIAGNYFEAAIEYEKAIYKGVNYKTQSRLKYHKAICYRSQERYKNAIDELSRINLRLVHDTLKVLILYEKAFNYLEYDQYQLALLNIRQINPKWTSKETYDKTEVLKILILNQVRDWEKARVTFEAWINKQPLSPEIKEKYIDTLALLYKKKKLPKDYSVERARNWSRFIPGAGQIYAGHTLEGLGSFVLNASVIAFAGYEAYLKYYITGYVVGLGTFYKSYFGGMERAANLAKIEKHNEMEQFNARCIQIFLGVLNHE